MKRFVRVADLLLGLALAMVNGGCGGGNNTPPPPASLTTLDVTAASPSVNIATTPPPSVNFIGTQAPGDIWQITLTHTDQFLAIGHFSDGSAFDITDSVTWNPNCTPAGAATIDSSGQATGVAAGTCGVTATKSGITSNIFVLTVIATSATNGSLRSLDQGTAGLPGSTIQVLIGTFGTVPAGLRRAVLVNPLGRVTYVVEMPGEMALVQGATVQGLGRTDKAIVAVANSCPQLSATTNYQFVALPTKTFATTDAAYGVLGVTQTSSSPNNYNVALNTFRLDGTGHASNTFPTVSCDSTFQVLSIPGTNPGPVTMAFSGHGAMVIDNGTGIPAVGLQQLSTSLPASAIFAGQYLGAVFKPNDPSNPPQLTEMVGFGPGSGSSISGGTYTNMDTDPFAAHATDHVITLGAQISPGLFAGGTFTVRGNTIANLDAVVGQANGKFVLFGVTADNSFTPPQPYAVLLIQQ